MLKITKRKEKKRKEKLVPRLAITRREIVALREKERKGEGWGWSRVTRSLLECLRRRLITQLRGFSRMLISRNTCKTRTARARASFPLEDPVVLEARLGDEGLDCTRRLKRDQKEAAHVAEEISTYTLLHARELVCGTRTRVQREGWRGRRGAAATYARARLFRVPPLEGGEGRRDQCRV